MGKANGEKRSKKYAEKLMRAYLKRVVTLTAEQARERFYHDGKNLRYRTGKKAGELAGNCSKRDKGYRQVRIGKDPVTGKAVYAQSTHIIHLMERGHFPQPGHSVDHEDGDTFDDSIEKLRLATPSQQRQNQLRIKTDGLPQGVRYLDDGKIEVPEYHVVGSVAEAKKVFNEVKRKRYGNFARTWLYSARQAISGAVDRFMGGPAQQQAASPQVVRRRPTMSMIKAHAGNVAGDAKVGLVIKAKPTWKG